MTPGSTNCLTLAAIIVPAIAFILLGFWVCFLIIRRRATPPSGLNYSCPDLLHSGQAVDLLPLLSHRGDTFPTKFTVFDGQLPAGLKLDKTTGAINGNLICFGTAPMKSSNVCIRAKNLKGHSDFHMLLQVQMHAAPANLCYRMQSEALVVGVPVAIEPTLNAGVPSTRFKVMCQLAGEQPSHFTLPAGLLLNPATGTISGVPEKPTERCFLKITAYNDSGETFFDLQLVIFAQQAPSALTYPSISGCITLAVGEACSYVPSFFQGLPQAVFRVSPPLPRGISLNEKSGEIAGTALEESPVIIFTVLLHNAKGACDFKFGLQVQLQKCPQGLTYELDQLKGDSSFYCVFSVGKAVDPTIMLPSLTEGNYLAFKVEPPLPRGLNLNPTNGAIYGVPEASTTKRVYTITASNRLGSAQTLFPMATCSSLLTCKVCNWTIDQVYLWAEELFADQVDARVGLLGSDGARLLLLNTEEKVEIALPVVDRTMRRLLLREIEGLIKSEVPFKASNFESYRLKNKSKMQFDPIRLCTTQAKQSILEALRSQIICIVVIFVCCSRILVKIISHPFKLIIFCFMGLNDTDGHDQVEIRKFWLSSCQ
jgi:hypothetical protein